MNSFLECFDFLSHALIVKNRKFPLEGGTKKFGSTQVHGPGPDMRFYISKLPKSRQSSHLSLTCQCFESTLLNDGLRFDLCLMTVVLPLSLEAVF